MPFLDNYQYHCQFVQSIYMMLIWSESIWLLIKIAYIDYTIALTKMFLTQQIITEPTCVAIVCIRNQSNSTTRKYCSDFQISIGSSDNISKSVTITVSKEKDSETNEQVKFVLQCGVETCWYCFAWLAVEPPDNRQPCFILQDWKSAHNCKLNLPQQS